MDLKNALKVSASPMIVRVLLQFMVHCFASALDTRMPINKSISCEICFKRRPFCTRTNTCAVALLFAFKYILTASTCVISIRMDLALRLRVNNSDHRVRGVRMPGSGQLLLYASDALAVLINTTRTKAMMHYVALSRRVPDLRHLGRPLGSSNHTQLCYKHNHDVVVTLEGLLRIATITRSPRAVANRTAFVCALCALFASQTSIRGAT